MGLKVGAGASGNHQGGANSVSQVNGVSDMPPACCLCGSSKEQWPLPALLFVRILPPTALTLIPDTSAPPLTSPLFFKWLPQYWSSHGVSPSRSVHEPFKRNFLGLKKHSISLSLNPCGFLQPGIMGTSVPGTGILGWAGD